MAGTRARHAGATARRANVRGNYQRRQITQYGVWDDVSDGDTPVLDPKGKTLGRSTAAASTSPIWRARCGSTAGSNLVSSGNVFDAMGNARFEAFDPGKSRWLDVSAQAPWGMGARMPLIPFRTLAHNPRKEAALYGRKVYVAARRARAAQRRDPQRGVHRR